MTKLAVSPSGVIAISTGYAQLAERLNEFVIGAGSMAISEMISRLPVSLRARAAAKRSWHLDHGFPYDDRGACALVGYDYGAARGVIFLEERGFDPIEADAWSSPHVNVARPSTAAEALAVAQAQMRLLRRTIPDATGLNFTVAKLGAGRVVKTTVPLLIGAESPSALASPASQWSPAHHAAALRDAEVRRRLGY